MFRNDVPGIALASTLPDRIPVCPEGVAMDPQGALNAAPSAVASSTTVCSVSCGKPAAICEEQTNATAKLAVPLGMERLSKPALSVCAVKAPEPILAATALGVPSLNVKVTTV